eukprot:m.92814 g.92814  ORF g.92814 m.92814 type:complete len:559 (-) comp13366_c0_seq1:1451-3127(-)
MAAFVVTTVLLALVHSTAAAGEVVMLVDIRSVPDTIRTQVLVCSGLVNRAAEASADGPRAYTIMGDEDLMWQQTLGITVQNTSVTGFLQHCFQGPAAGHILYNHTEQQLLVPLIVTLAGVLNAVPIERGDSNANSTKVVFDALAVMGGMTPLDATRYVFEHYGNETSTMSMMDPGYDNGHDPFNPKLVRTPNLGLVDYIVKEKLFNFYMVLACIPGEPEHALMSEMVSNNPWPRPITVFGYNDAFGIAGDLFEAETSCVAQHNLGQVASDGFNNLAYFSIHASSTPFVQKPLRSEKSEQFNASKTYINFVIGDGDNLNFIKGSRADWMKTRVSRCTASNGTRCFPLSWTISPKLYDVAPPMLQWYIDQTKRTMADYFILPPSGDLYSYPSMMKDEDQAKFVAHTERDCIRYNSTGTIAWEMFYSWKKAFEDYFPRYAEHDTVRGIFTVNVPFMFPIEQFKLDEFYRIVNGKTVVFKQREWRGPANNNTFTKIEYIDAPDLAKEINSYKPGTATYIYLTSDGGASVTDFFDLAELLAEHVTITDHNSLVEFVREKEQLN